MEGFNETHDDGGQSDGDGVKMTTTPMMLMYIPAKMLRNSLVGVLPESPNCLVVFGRTSTHMRHDRQVGDHENVSNAIFIRCHHLSIAMTVAADCTIEPHLRHSHRMAGPMLLNRVVLNMYTCTHIDRHVHILLHISMHTCMLLCRECKMSTSPNRDAHFIQHQHLV